MKQYIGDCNEVMKHLAKCNARTECKGCDFYVDRHRLEELGCGGCNPLPPRWKL